MSKYSLSDDGKTIDGKIVVFLSVKGGAAPAAGPRTGVKGADGEHPEDVARPGPAEREALAGAQASSLASAAADGVPFCEECEQARKALAAS